MAEGIKIMKTKKIMACDWGKYYKKLHPYDVKTTGRHPVHMIEGGDYLTEDDTTFNECSDMGWFFLNQKEYDFFKSHLEEVELKVVAY